MRRWLVRLLERWAGNYWASSLEQAEDELEKTRLQLRLAQEENRLLAAIHEGDVSRRFREMALHNRDRAIAEADTPKPEEE